MRRTFVALGNIAGLVTPRRSAVPERTSLNIAVLAGCTSHKGGLEVMCLQVAREMSRRGHRVILIYRDEGDAFQFFEDIVSARYKLKLGPLGIRYPVSSSNLIRCLLQLVKEQRIDVCFSSNLGLARTTGVLHVLTGVPSVYHFGLTCGDDARIDAFTRWGIRQASIGIAPTSRAAESWQQAGIAAKRMEVCPNWTDTNRFRRLNGLDRREKRRVLGLETDALLVAYVGRLSVEKGVRSLLQAAKLLSADGMRFSLVLVGNLVESYRDEFTAAVSTFNSEVCTVRIVSQVNNPEDYFAVSDVAVVPSTATDTFPLTLLEAMASELPTLASRANSFPEIVGAEHDDLLFPVGSARECAKLLKTWLTVDEAKRLERGRQLRARVLRHFSPANALAYEAAFQRVLAERGAPSTR